MDNNKIYSEWFELVPYGVQGRYPYQLEVTEEDMINAIKCAEKIEEFVKGKIDI